MEPLPEDDPFLAAQADIHQGVRWPLVHVCPEPKLQFLHNGTQGSLAASVTNGMADDSPVSDGRAYGLDEVHVDSLNGKYNVFVLADTGVALKEFYQQALVRETPFESDTYFAFVLLSGWTETLARLVQRRFIEMGAVEITPLHVIAQTNQAARLQAVHTWSINQLQQGIVTIMRGLMVQQQLFVARQHNPDKAYAVLDQNAFAPIPLGGGRGHVYKGTMLHRNGDLFMVPSEETAVHVAIKVLDVSVVMNLLQQGSNENSWRELTRLLLLQETGFVPEFFEALFDGRYLYIITRWADGGSLLDAIRRHPEGRMPIEEARSVARQIFDILNVLHERYGIVHHDLKPANFLIHGGRVLVTDFAQSLLVPPGGRLRAVDIPQDLRGSLAYMLPEHFAGQDYDARQFDLWTVGATLFALVTGISMMYRVPSDQDFLYEYIVLARQVSRTPQNPRVQAILDQLDDQITLITGYMEMAVIDVVLNQSSQNAARAASLTNYLEDLKAKRSAMTEIAAKIQSLPESLLELFERVFDPDPQRRWPRERLVQMPWMTNN